MAVIQNDHSKPSMLEKSFERRRVNREHNSNFRAGHVAVHETHLHKTGLRGRKSYLAVAFLLCLAVVALINFMLTLWILFGVHINRHGSKVFNFLVEGTLQFQVPSDLRLVDLIGEGILGGFQEEELCLSSDGSNITLKQQAGPKVFVGPGKTRFVGNSFEVTNPLTGRRVFSTEDMSNLKLHPATKIKSEGQVQVNQVVSPTGKGLTIRSDESIYIHGNEGATFRARKINLMGQNVELSGAGQLILEGQSSAGVYLNASILPRPLVGPLSTSRVYKLCMCGDSGKVFGVTVSANSTSPCQELDESFNLCQ